MVGLFGSNGDVYNVQVVCGLEGVRIRTCTVSGRLSDAPSFTINWNTASSIVRRQAARNLNGRHGRRVARQGQRGAGKLRPAVKQRPAGVGIIRARAVESHRIIAEIAGRPRVGYRELVCTDTLSRQDRCPG